MTPQKTPCQNCDRFTVVNVVGEKINLCPMLGHCEVGLKRALKDTEIAPAGRITGFEGVIRLFPDVDVYEIKIDARRKTYTVSGRTGNGDWFECDPLPVGGGQ